VPDPGPEYQPPSSPAYTSATKLPPTRAGAGTAGATTPPATPAAHLADSGSPDGGNKRGRGGIIAAIVLVIALVGAGGAFFLFSGDDDQDDNAAPAATEEPSDTGDTGAETTAPPVTDAPTVGFGEPVDAAQAFFTAAVAGDCPGMAQLLTEGSLLMDNGTVDEALADCQQSVADGDTGFEDMTVANVTLVSEEGDTAIVSVDFDVAGQASTEQFHLQRVDGEWKMDLEASA